MKNALKKPLCKIAVIAVVSSLLAFCFALTACVWDPGRYHFTNEYLDDVVSIELINYDNPEQKSFGSWVPDHSSKLKPFDLSKASIIEDLDSNKITDFNENLCEYLILYKYYAYDSPNGICIKLNYSNDDFIIIWSDYQSGWFGGYIGKFSADGNVVDFIGSFSGLGYYKSLVNDYFQTQI